MDLNDAIRFAVEAHKGQLDLNDEPIILHVLRVMLAVPKNLRIPAVLHDVVEDTPYTLYQLESRGVSDQDLLIVDAMTRRKGERYWDYIRRLERSLDAIPLKIADIRDNMRPDRAHPRSPTSRYIKALAILERHVGSVVTR